LALLNTPTTASYDYSYQRIRKTKFQAHIWWSNSSPGPLHRAMRHKHHLICPKSEARCCRPCRLPNFYLAASGLAFNIIAIGQMLLQENPTLLSKVRDKGDSLEFRPLQRGFLYISELACWVFFVQFLHMYETPQERTVSWVDSQNLWIIALPLILVAKAIRTVLQIRMSLDEDFRKERYLPKAEGSSLY
jgi:hypothetical protein